MDQTTAVALGIRLRARRHAERDHGLRSAMTLRREAYFSDDPAVLALRLLFCGEALTSEERAAAIGGLHVPRLHLRIAGGLFIASD